MFKFFTDKVGENVLLLMSKLIRFDSISEEITLNPSKLRLKF